MGIVESIVKMSRNKKMNAFGVIIMLATVVPIWYRLGIPVSISYYTQDFYNAIVKLPEGKGILVFGWETMRFDEYVGKQDACAALFNLIHKRGLKILCLSLGAVAPLFFEDIYKRNDLVKKYNLKYGEDYVITPFISGEETALAAFAKDAWSSVSTDLYGNPIGKLPLMQKIRTLADVDLTIMSAYSWSNVDQYIRQWGWAWNKPIVYFLGDFYNIAYAYPWPVLGVVTQTKGLGEFEFLTAYPGMDLAKLEALNTNGLVYLVLIAAGIAYSIMQMSEKKVAGGVAKE